MIYELSTLSQAAIPTPFHQVLRMLDDRGKLLRVYTQNIDALELKAGLSFGVHELPEHRGISHGAEYKTPRCIPLHGTLQTMYCERCAFSSSLEEHWTSLASGIRPICPKCDHVERSRTKLGKRPHSVGSLRPGVVLYGETHREGDRVGKIVSDDFQGKGNGQGKCYADVVLVVGTSLKVPGTMQIVKGFSQLIHSNAATNSARSSCSTGIHQRPAKVLYLNLNFPTPTNTWSGVFDAWIQGDAQAFAAMLCDEMLKELQVDGAQGTKRKQQVDNAESTNRKRRRNTKLSSTPKKILFLSTYIENSKGNAAACRVSGPSPGGHVASQEKLGKQE